MFLIIIFHDHIDFLKAHALLGYYLNNYHAMQRPRYNLLGLDDIKLSGAPGYLSVESNMDNERSMYM